VVTRDGEPLAEVEVVFLPDPEKGNFGPHAAAYTDAAGHYRLRCEALDADGAVVGPHRVIVRDIAALPDPPGAPRGPRAKAGRPKASRVPLAYTQPATTPFRDVEVHPGHQTRDFELASQ
jgi:hypothetical protein